MRHLVFPIVKTEAQRSKKPLKRIDIEEINDESIDKIELVKNTIKRANFPDPLLVWR